MADLKPGTDVLVRTYTILERGAVAGSVLSTFSSERVQLVRHCMGMRCRVCRGEKERERAPGACSVVPRLRLGLAGWGSLTT